MKASDLPAFKFPVPFAASGAPGTVTFPIPTAPQSGGHASLTTGFTQTNFTPVAAGGVPPWGDDMNGVLLMSTGWIQALQAGQPIPYDATFSAAIAGYPKGALLSSASQPGQAWASLVDDNPTNPDASGANWAPCALVTSSAGANATVSVTYTCNGNPNGQLKGTAATGTTAPDTAWDLINQVLYTCTTTGSAGTAVWKPLITSNSPGSGLSTFLVMRASTGTFVMEWGFTTIDAGSTAFITLRVTQGSPQYAIFVTPLNLGIPDAGSVGVALGQTTSNFTLVNNYQHPMPVSWWIIGGAFGL